MSRMNESCHIRESCHVWMSHVTYEWVMSSMIEGCHVCMSHVTYEWVTHVWMSHVTYRVQMRHTWMSHVPHVNEPCHAWTSHVTYLHKILAGLNVISHHEHLIKFLKISALFLFGILIQVANQLFRMSTICLWSAQPCVPLKILKRQLATKFTVQIHYRTVDWEFRLVAFDLRRSALSFHPLVYIYICVSVCVCMYIWIYTYVFMYMYIYTYIYIYKYIYIYTYTYIHKHLYIFVCIYMYV